MIMSVFDTGGRNTEFINQKIIQIRMFTFPCADDSWRTETRFVLSLATLIPCI